MWTASSVTYDATRGSFNLTGGAVGVANVIVVAGTGGSDIAGQLGWLSATTILSDGAAQQSITDLLEQSTAGSNDFGSFCFLDTLTQDQIVEAATWNKDQNNMYMYSVPVTDTTASAISAALILTGGVTLTLDPLAEFAEYAPMAVLAATDYTAPNSTQNFMFQTGFDLTPSVVSDTDADTYDALRVNYYGQTQTAGQQLSFYQRGYMMGISTDPLDQNTYVNEMWLKDAMGAAVMTLLLSLAKVSANAQGRAQILSVMQGVIDQALFNGVISVGRTLTDVQKLYIGEISNDPNAWYAVQNAGYWFDVVITPFIVDGSTQFKAVYTLIYAKDDVIRKVEGTDILI
jgi:hypothetical protein